MMYSLSIVLDQKGISNHVVADLLNNCKYHTEMEWLMKEKSFFCRKVDYEIRV